MEILHKERYHEFEAFNKTHEFGSFMQSERWARIKSGWGHEVIVSRDEGGAIVGGMSVLIKRLPIFPFTLLYAPRGPVCDLNDFDVIDDLINGVRELKRKHRAYMFVMDPYVMASDELFIKRARMKGFLFTPGMADFTTIQTRNNYMLNIKNRTPDEVFASFHSKWRYNIRVAEKKGVTCVVGDTSYLDDFYALMRVTGERDGFIIRPKAYFEKMMNELGEHCRLYMCYYQGIPVSGAITTQYAGKTCYVYGASDNNHRNVMPNHLMQWEMIKWAIEGGCFLYDFQGIPFYFDENDPHYGVYRFKKGFNGEVVEFAGEFNLVFNSFIRFIADSGEKLSRRMKARKRKPVQSAETKEQPASDEQ